MKPEEPRELSIPRAVVYWIIALALACAFQIGLLYIGGH